MSSDVDAEVGAVTTGRASPISGTDGSVSFFSHVRAIAWKDLLVEFRSREILYTMVLFAVMIVLIFSFAFVKEGAVVGGDDAQNVRLGDVVLMIGDIASGILWIAVLFAGTLGLSRAFLRERESDTMRGLLISPAPRAALFLGKAVGIAVFIMVTEVIIVPLVAFLFEAPLFRDPLALVLTLLLANLGFAVIGSVFAGMLLRTRSRDVLLPIVLYPILVPLMIAATKSTGALAAATPEPMVAWFWIKFLVVFDALFVTVAVWSFESLVIE